MTTLLMKRATVVVASSGGAQAVAVIPDSSQFLGFSIVITGFGGLDLGKEFEIQGSINGTDFFKLDATTAFLPTPHAISSATPVMIMLELYTPLPGGLRVVSTLANLTIAGEVQVMMYNTAFNPGRS